MLRSSSKRNSARALATSVFPTPVGPRKRNEPIGRLGSLSPARVRQVILDEEEMEAIVVVPDHQLSLAIGKEGQNARLAARLTGYKIDIRSESQDLGLEVDEETGLNGAKKLEPGFIEGKVLLNVDSETEGVFTVGCAGGKHTHISRKLELTELGPESQLFSLNVSGLHGGHSGIDIIKQRASANKIMARILDRLAAAYNIRLYSKR